MSFLFPPPQAESESSIMAAKNNAKIFFMVLSSFYKIQIILSKGYASIFNRKTIYKLCGMSSYKVCVEYIYFSVSINISRNKLF